jgi:hypothetical protein
VFYGGTPNSNYLLRPSVTILNIFYTDLQQLLIQGFFINRLLTKSKTIEAQKTFRKPLKLLQIQISNFKTKRSLKTKKYVKCDYLQFHSIAWSPNLMPISFLLPNYFNNKFWNNNRYI